MKIKVTYVTIMGSTLNLARKRQGKTQEYLAKVAGISPSTYSRIENGKQAISTLQLLSFTKSLFLNMSEFFAEVEETIRELEERKVEIVYGEQEADSSVWLDVNNLSILKLL